jgi:predicted O-methyltransferase YrrM
LIRPTVSAIVHRSRRLLGFGLPPRHPNDYATHVPILVGIASAFRIVKILEFGSGLYSTLTFLNRFAYPDVREIDSIETDPQWMSKISNAASEDSRLRMHLVEEPIERVLENFVHHDYDLVFVDSSTDAKRRASLLGALARTKSLNALIALHDFEVGLYRAAAQPFANRVECAAYNPSTGVLWQSDPGRANTIRGISRIVRRYSRKLPPDDVQSWSAVFRKERGLKTSVE